MYAPFLLLPRSLSICQACSSIELGLNWRACWFNCIRVWCLFSAERLRLSISLSTISRRCWYEEIHKGNSPLGPEAVPLEVKEVLAKEANDCRTLELGLMKEKDLSYSFKGIYGCDWLSSSIMPSLPLKETEALIFVRLSFGESYVVGAAEQALY